MKEFKYDVLQLINAIRVRPCLWDKTIENYKDRVERRGTWEEIFNMLEDRYDEMTPEGKRYTGEHILNKWTNVRDTFMKSLKTKMGRPKRKYIYYDQLKFLLKITGDETEHNDYMNETEEIPYMKHETDTQEIESQIIEPLVTNSTRKHSKRLVSEESETESNNLSISTIVKTSNKKKSKRNDFDDIKSNDSYSHKKLRNTEFDTSSGNKKKSKRPETMSQDDSNSVNDIDFIEVDETDNPRVMNEDEAFFASLLPTIVRYSEDERLEFRIEVLGVMKKLHDKRKWTDK